MSAAIARGTRGRALVAVVAMLLLAGCVRGCKSRSTPIHINPNMDLQPKATAQAESGFFYDGATMREPVPGTVARGELRDGSPYYTGKDAGGTLLASIPVEITPELMARGANRFAIFCAPCHGPSGDGNGIPTQRANVRVPGFTDEKVLNKPDGHYFDVITNGFGLMSSYRYPVGVADRWAIVAHVRHLQGLLEVPSPDVADADPGRRGGDS